MSKCGYKILYNRKIKITPLLNGNLTNNNINNFIYNNKILYHKKGLADNRKKNKEFIVLKLILIPKR